MKWIKASISRGSKCSKMAPSTRWSNWGSYHRSSFIPQKPRNLSSPLFELWKREYKIISYENVHNYDFSGVFSFNTFIIDLSCWLAVFLSFAFGKSIDVLSISITSTPRSDIYAICHLIIWHIEILPGSSGGGDLCSPVCHFLLGCSVAVL